MAVIEAPVDYDPNFLPKETADRAFEVLMADLPWRRHDTLPREEVYFNDTPVPYTYGAPGRERTYVPEAEWHPMVRAIRRSLEEDLDLHFPLDVCFLNRYTGPRGLARLAR